MKYVCKENQCTGCMACVEACSQNAIKINDGIIAFNAVIDPEKCKGCTKCARNCPVGAITGNKKEPHSIDTSKCIKCGTCLENCVFGAISVN